MCDQFHDISGNVQSSWYHNKNKGRKIFGEFSVRTGNNLTDFGSLYDTFSAADQILLGETSQGRCCRLFADWRRLKERLIRYYDKTIAATCDIGLWSYMCVKSVWNAWHFLPFFSENFWRGCC